MQLKKLSILTAIALSISTVYAEDYVSVQFLGYDEDSGRTTVFSPIFGINKDFGTDYSFNLSFGADSISGASPTFYDSLSGASAGSRGVTSSSSVAYGDIDYDDVRKFVSLSGTKRFSSRDELLVGISTSDESDYRSLEISSEYLHYLDSSKNRSITIGGSYQKNSVLIPCHGNPQCDSESGASKSFDIDVINVELGFTQIIDKTSLFKTSIFYGLEDGYLGNPYMNIVRNFSTTPLIEAERKPDTRSSYGATLQYIKALNDKLSAIGDYRYYSDDWEISSHTISLELNYDLSDKWSFGSGVRYYTQSEAKFYNENMDYFTSEKYASSDRRMSSLDSINYKVSADYKLSEKISINSSIIYYDQPDWFNSIYYTIGAKYFY